MPEPFVRAPAAAERQEDERLIAVREVVLDDAEHAVGNLLQRLHHVARAAGGELGMHGERLQVALDDLERLLDLLFAYVTPVEIELRATDAGRIAESLAAQLRGQHAEVQVGAGGAVRVLADARAIGRSFQLLAQARAWNGPVTLGVLHDAGRERVEFVLQAAPEGPATAHGKLAAAVAARLIELQGGELRAAADGRWVIALPVAG